MKEVIVDLILICQILGISIVKREGVIVALEFLFMTLYYLIDQVLQI